MEHLGNKVNREYQDKLGHLAQMVVPVILVNKALLGLKVLRDLLVQLGQQVNRVKLEKQVYLG